MLNFHRRISLLCLKGTPFPPPTLNPFPSPFSLHFCTTSSDYSHSFPVSYLINNLGFSPQSASKLSSTYNLRFKTAKTPDAVLTFFRNRGFSDTQLRLVIEKAPRLLSCDPFKRLLPKFEFFLSKGASASDIVELVSRSPIVLSPSLEKQLVPTYELAYRFLKSDKDTIALLYVNPILLSDSRLPRNVRMLIENGVTESNIARLLRTSPRVFNTRNLLKVVEELKDMGFDPSKSTFPIAFTAKVVLSKTRWNEKVDAFKKWGVV